MLGLVFLHLKLNFIQSKVPVQVGVFKLLNFGIEVFGIKQTSISILARKALAFYGPLGFDIVLEILKPSRRETRQDVLLRTGTRP